MVQGSYKGLNTSLRYFRLENSKFKLRKGYSLPFGFYLLKAKVTSPIPYFQINQQSDLSKDSPYLNSITSNSEPSFFDDLSLIEIRGSIATIAIQFSELTRNRICLGYRKQTRKIDAFSLELNTTLSNVLNNPFKHRSPLICSSISNLILDNQTISNQTIQSINNNVHIYQFHLTFLSKLNEANIIFQSTIWNNKIKMIRENSGASNFEKKFSTQQALRRNKNYYDILKLNSEEHCDEQRRRKPMLKKQSANSKIQKTFQNAIKQTNSKLDSQIQKFKFRLSFYQSPSSKNDITESTRYEDNPSPPRQRSPREIKGVPIDKFVSRQSIHRRSNKPVVDQRQFNNFYLVKPDLTHVPNIASYSPRNSDIALSHMTGTNSITVDLYYNSQTKYEQICFDNKTTSCIFNLKKQNDQKQRYFFIPKREEDKPSTDLNPEHVGKSFSVANPYKTAKILHFYKVNGRELPSQFDSRFLTPNKHFYKDKNGKLIKEQMSFTARKYKDELLIRDLQQIKTSKKPYFQRDEICDERYFKQQKRSYDAKHQQ